MNDHYSRPAPYRPPAGKTPQRQIRVPDDPFYRAVDRAKREGSSIGAVTTELLRRYAEGELDAYDTADRD